MKKTALILLLVTISIHYSFSQNSNQKDKKDKSPFWKNVQFGGGINVGVGNNVTNLGISPSAVYKFNDKFKAGVGLSYLYSKFRNSNNSINLYGASLISLYNPINEIQLSAEFEENIINQSGFDSRNVEALFLGAGYSAGRNVTIGIRYDVLYDENESVYGDAIIPFVRIYF